MYKKYQVIPDPDDFIPFDELEEPITIHEIDSGECGYRLGYLHKGLVSPHDFARLLKDCELEFVDDDDFKDIDLFCSVTYSYFRWIYSPLDKANMLHESKKGKGAFLATYCDFN